MTATKKKWKDKTLKEKIGTIGEKGKPIADTSVAINKEGQPGAIGGDDFAEPISLPLEQLYRIAEGGNIDIDIDETSIMVRA